MWDFFLGESQYFAYSSLNCITTTYMKKKKSRKGSIYEIEIIKLLKIWQISMTQMVWTRDFISFFLWNKLYITNINDSIIIL